MAHIPMYFIAGFAAVVLVATGAFVFLRTEPDSTARTWGGVSGLFAPSQPSELPALVQQSYEGGGRESLGIIPLPQQEGSAETFATDLAELLAQLTQPLQTSDEHGSGIPSGYAFIPQGFVSAEVAPERTPEQQALYTYGNTIGLSLRTFADLHPNMPQILKDQAEDRTDPFKVSALETLAQDFSRLGDELAALDSVPGAATSAHGALVAAYQDVGVKLLAIPNAQNSDEAFLAAVNTYNTAAENLSQRLVALVDLFGTRNVTFSSSDPGNIFVFSASSSF